MVVVLLLGRVEKDEGVVGATVDVGAAQACDVLISGRPMVLLLLLLAWVRHRLPTLATTRCTAFISIGVCACRWKGEEEEGRKEGRGSERRQTQAHPFSVVRQQSFRGSPLSPPSPIISRRGRDVSQSVGQSVSFHQLTRIVCSRGRGVHDMIQKIKSNRCREGNPSTHTRARAVVAFYGRAACLPLNPKKEKGETETYLKERRLLPCREREGTHMHTHVRPSSKVDRGLPPSHDHRV